MTEPATKRRKTAGELTETDEEDELFLEPEELNQRRDPAFQLAKGRAKAATQLKSRFEDIFAKYEKDFTGVGDEIDLATGEVIVDNGHLSSMRSMKDWIVDDEEDDDNEDDEDEYEDGEGEEDKQAPSMNVDEKRPDSADRVSKESWRIAEPGWASEFESKGPPPLESLLPAQLHFRNPSHSSPPFAPESLVNVDPAWQAPELPASAFLSKTVVSTGRHYGGATPVVTRTVLRSSIPTPDNPEASGEDDLQTALGIAPKRKETGGYPVTGDSPLIKLKFPVVDSSPQDNGLEDLIHEVIENIPDTPPSIRRSSLLRPPGKLFPLGQEHRTVPRTKSKLRISDTPLDHKSREAPKKRGRKPKAGAHPIIADAGKSSLRDQALWEECDLAEFIDVTTQGIIKPAGQTLYIDIRASSSTASGMATPEELQDSSITDVDAEDEGFRSRGKLPVRSLVKGAKATHVANATLDHQEASVNTKPDQRRDTDKPKSQNDFQRNIVDSAFIFSDEETLLPKRSRQKSRQSELNALAQDGGAARCRKNTPKSGGAGTESPMLAKAAAMDAQIPECLASDCVTEKQRQPVRLSSKPHRASGTTVTQDKTLMSSTGNGLSSSKRTEEGIGSDPRGSSPLEQETERSVAEADIRMLRSPRQTRPAADKCEPREVQMVAVEAAMAGGKMGTDIPWARSRRSTQPQSPAVSKQPMPAEKQPTQPVTPRRPRAKQGEGKTPSSVDTSLLLLLSDADDDEDEISFTHSDFTPAGHHRILVHRPFPQLSTTPRFSSSKMDKKKRPSLLYGRSHSASSHKVSKTQRTPRSAGSKSAGTASHRKNHRRRHKLARSVVRVVRRHDSDDDDREGSVVQTPGGSKRRCGVEGWKCERDFCFVCME